MNYAIRILFTLALTASFSITNTAIAAEDMSKTIILINGTPYFVEMDENGRQIEKIVAVPTYFRSNESHDEILEKANSDYEDELPNLKSRLLIFEEDQAILDQIAVDHIRDLARLYAKGYVQSINITAAHYDNNKDEALAAYRVNAIYQMFKDFGVDDEGIVADMKEYKSDLPNVYVQLKIKK